MQAVVSTRSEGISLLIGSFLMFITMVLHPTGGDLAHIREIWVLAVSSHAIAIASIPFLALGFWGLQLRLRAADFLSKTGFAIMLTGLVAVLIAAALNGLAYPIYAEMNSGASADAQASLEMVTRYGFAMNHAFDYIFMGAVCISTILWSVAMIRTKSFPVWLGYVGLLLSILALGMWIAGFVFINLHGFRIFIFGWFLWVVLTGYFLLQAKEN